MGEWTEKTIENIPKNWKIGQLDELADVIDPHPSHRAPKIVNDGFPFAGIGDISENGDIDIHKARKVGEETLIEQYDRYKISEFSIGYGRVGTVGKVVRLKPQPYKYCISPTLAIVNPKKGTDPRFLYSVVRDTSFLGLVEQNMTGSTRPAIGIQILRTIQILIPPLLEQTAIASVLSSLDDKIDLMNRQNATLEKMAETLFRKWFVEDAKEDWEETTLYDAIKLIGGGTPKTSISEYWDGNIKWLSGGDIASNHKRFVVKSEKSITELGLKNSSAKLLPKFSTIISARGTVGKYCMLSEQMAYSQSNYGILPKYKGCYFFTYLLVAYSVDELQSAAYGTVFDTITTNTFKGLNINLPEDVCIIKFEELVKPYFFKILSNQIQIRIITAMRDTLLPRLMSGEVRVKM